MNLFLFKINKIFLFILIGFNLLNFSCKKNDDPVSSAQDLPRPSNVTAIPISPSQIELTWEDNTTNETGFLIEISKGSLENLEETKTTGPNFTRFRITFLKPGTEYFLRVRAVHGRTESFYSNVTQAKTFANEGVWIESVSDIDLTLQGVQMLDGHTIIAVGDRGIILRSENFGATWSKPFSRTEERLLDVSFLDFNNGMVSSANLAGGFSIVLQTFLGGRQWLERDILLQKELWAIEYINALTAIVVGAEGAIAKTLDGGSSWRTINSPTANDLLGIDFINDKSGFVVGSSGTLLQTSDGGNTWTPQTVNPKLTFWSLAFSDSSTGYIVGENGTILKSNDAGLSWTKQTTGLTETLFGVAFVTPDTGIVVGQNGAILQTTDGGDIWKVQNSNTKNTLLDVHFFDAQHGVAVGEYGAILLTSVGGQTP